MIEALLCKDNIVLVETNIVTVLVFMVMVNCIFESTAAVENRIQFKYVMEYPCRHITAIPCLIVYFPNA